MAGQQLSFSRARRRKWRSRVFLAGDAAHQQPPFIGQGMCQGLRDVTNLCWKMISVLHGESGDALLNTYEEERNEHVPTLTRASSRSALNLHP